VFVLSLDEALSLLRKANEEIVRYIEREGYNEKVKTAREYFIDAVNVLLDKKVDNAIYLLNKAIEVLSR